MTFDSLGPLTVENYRATDISQTGATLNAQLVSGGAGDLTIYWGLSDGGSDPAAWDHTNDLGQVINGWHSTSLALQAAGTYYYRAYVTNDLSEDWADTTRSFRTLAPVLSLGARTVGFSPTNIPGCRLWLRADAGVQTDGNGNVTEWQDQSGHRNHASQANAAWQPVYINQPGALKVVLEVGI